MAPHSCIISAPVCRYVAAVTGSTESLYCTVMSCTASQALVICQTRLHAGELPCEPWHMANCIQLESFRSVLCIMTMFCAAAYLRKT